MKKLFLSILFILTFSFNTFSADNIDSAVVIKIEGVITGYTHKYISLALEKAAEGNSALLMKLDTPGGLLSATRDIVQTILESDTPVITFVSPQGARAGSAGTFIVMSSHYAAMSEGSNIGAAHPVNVTGKDIKGDMADKVVNDTVAFIKSIADKRNRNKEVAVKMITESLSLTAREAAEKNIVNSVNNSISSVIKSASNVIDISENAEIKEIKPTALQKIAFFLSNPNVLVLLLMIGVLSIILEINMPGTFIFAAFGAVAIILFLFGINIIPINLLSLLLVAAGVVLLVLEMFIPSFGLLTLSSIVSLVFGLFLMFDKEGNIGVNVSIWLILSVVLFVVVIGGIVGRLILKDFRKKPAAGIDKLVGMTGRVISFEGSSGKMFVNGEIWNISSNDSLKKDDDVVVLEYDGIKLIVRKKEL